MTTKILSKFYFFQTKTQAIRVAGQIIKRFQSQKKTEKGQHGTFFAKHDSEIKQRLKF